MNIIYYDVYGHPTTGAASFAVIYENGDYVIDRDITCRNVGNNGIIFAAGLSFVKLRLRSRITADLNVSGAFSSGAAGIEGQGCDAFQIFGEGGYIDGFGHGIRSEGSDNLTIKDVMVLRALQHGIRVGGNDVEIEDCRVNYVGGFVPPGGGVSRNFAFRVVGGSDVLLRNNYAKDVISTGDEEACLFSIDEGSGLLAIVGNYGRFAQRRTRQFGVWFGGYTDGRVLYNTIENSDYGICSSGGIRDHNTLINCLKPYNTEGGCWGPNNSLHECGDPIP